MSNWPKIRLFLSKKSPQGLKKLYRTLVWLTRKSVNSPAIPQDLLDNCVVVKDRHLLIDRLPKNAVVAEVGVWKGEFSKQILALAVPKHLVLVDIDLSMARDALPGDFAGEMIEECSADAASRFKEEHFDWVYVDAGHDYSSVKKDIEAWASRVKAGGFLVFNDFAHIDPALGRYGVHRAVSEFVVQNRWSVAYWALNTAGLYDIAIVKPRG